MVDTAPPPLDVPRSRPDPGDLATFWELALDVLVLATPEGEFLNVNPAFTRVLGWSRQQVIGLHASDFVHPDDLEATLAGFAEIDDPGSSVKDFENRYRTVDGEYRTLRWNARMGMDGGVIHAVARDMTEHHARMVALRLSEDRFRTSMRAAAIGMAIVDLDGRFAEVNDALCRIVGRPRDVLTTLTFADITHPDDLDVDLDLARQLAEGTIDHYDLEKRYLRPDGSEVCVLLTGSVVRNADGTPRHFIAQVQDISRRKEAEAELARTLDELRQSNQTLTDFALVAAHDLKTPLAVAIGAADLVALRYAGALPPEARRLFERSAAQLRLLSRQVDGLLRIASLGGRPMDLEDVVLEDAVATVVSMLGEMRGTTRLDVDAPDVVRVDRAALFALLQNLLANAVTHGGDHVQVRSHREDAHVRVEVDDDGHGVPAEDRERVFDLFMRSATDADGTGVGLALCRRVVERHGGQIGFDDAPNGGARVWFTLPAAD
jgi:PAS domain S-box-containing protein